MPIYIMCLPPENPQDLLDYFLSGVTEIAFNFEVFDEKLANQLLRGKIKKIDMVESLKSIE